MRNPICNTCFALGNDGPCTPCYEQEIARKEYRAMRLANIAAFVREHGFAATIVPSACGFEGYVSWECPWINVHTNERGSEIQYAYSYADARNTLGY